MTRDRSRLWLFRFAAAVVVPLLVLGSFEICLRLAGAGYPPSFLLPSATSDGGRVTNPRFGYRFFPPRIARAPVPFELRGEPADDSLRVFVVGGSAAMGTPEPAFGLARLLQEMLSRALPERRVEVHDAAMTAINSHVVLPIVRELARHQPDLFVVYLGNNEVVGPYGAATVFGPATPSLGMVRAAVAARSTRIGQLADRLLGGWGAAPDEWRGMEMFLEQRIAADDPRLEAVYRNLEQNLEDLVAAARDGGAEVVLSTVAVNLRDQAPFASLHREDLAESESARWQSLRDAALASLRSGDYLAALDGFEAAAAIDDGHAELHFLLGHALLGLGDAAGARRELERARDLDALRFRADSRINDVIRGVAERLDVPLVDAAERFAEGGSLPGRQLFHEHVHLNFLGNHALASAIFRTVWGALPGVSARAPAPASVEQLAESLPLTAFDVREMEREMYTLVGRPPFTAAFGQADDRAQRRRRLEALRLGLDAAEWRRARGQYEARLRSQPGDLDARRRFATLLGRHGEASESAEQWRILVQRIPGVLAWHDALAGQLAAAGRVDEALAEQRRLLEMFPEQSASILTNTGTLLEAAGRIDEARRSYRVAARSDSDDPRSRFNLATLDATEGQTELAVEQYLAILRQHPDFAPAYHNLGVAREQAGDLEAAAEQYRLAVEAQPDRAASHLALGVVLERQGRADEAFASYRHALEADPDAAGAYFRLGDLLLANGRAAEAVALYRGGLRLQPGDAAARRNLEAAQAAAGAAAETSDSAPPGR